MRLNRIAIVVACCLPIVGALAIACGGGPSSARAVDVSKVPTATLPASLPEPKIIGSGALQPGGGSSYTVKQGDTLAGIASRFGVSLEDLRAANPNIDGSTLSIGQSIRLPASTDTASATATQPPAPSASATSPPVEPTSAPVIPTQPPPADTPVPVPSPTAEPAGQTYTVVQGDIPLTIAEKFGITVEALLAANPGIDPTDLHIGDVLVIPPKPQ